MHTAPNNWLVIRRGSSQKVGDSFQPLVSTFGHLTGTRIKPGRGGHGTYRAYHNGLLGRPGAWGIPTNSTRYLRRLDDAANSAYLRRSRSGISRQHSPSFATWYALTTTDKVEWLLTVCRSCIWLGCVLDPPGYHRDSTAPPELQCRDGSSP